MHYSKDQKMRSTFSIVASAWDSSHLDLTTARSANGKSRGPNMWGAQHVGAQHVGAQHVGAQHVGAQHVGAQHGGPNMGGPTCGGPTSLLYS